MLSTKMRSRGFEPVASAWGADVLDQTFHMSLTQLDIAHALDDDRTPTAGFLLFRVIR